jgi:hypothetical protein
MSGNDKPERKGKKARRKFIAAAVLAGVTPAFGHHSFKAQYDDNSPVTLMGTVTRVDWRNPHVLLFVDVRSENGDVMTWELELASPNGLIREGWKVDSLKRGDKVTVFGFRARDGSNAASVRKVTLDGQ